MPGMSPAAQLVWHEAVPLGTYPLPWGEQGLVWVVVLSAAGDTEALAQMGLQRGMWPSSSWSKLLGMWRRR